MIWYAELERRRRTAVVPLLLVCVSIFAVACLRDPFAYDSWWHLKMGQDLVEQGLSPYRDHYSITHQGERIASPPVPFQLLLYGVVRPLGVEAGFKAFVFGCGLLTMGLMLAWLRSVRAPVLVVLLIMPMLVMLLMERIMVRPELISYPLSLLALILYEKARTGEAYKIMPWVALTLLAWTNFHSAILGYVIFFGLFLDIAIAQLRARAPRRVWAAWAGWGVVVLLVGFLNPSLSHPVLGQLTFSGGWAGEIQEYRESLRGFVSFTTLGLLAVAALTLALTLKQRLAGYFVVCAILGWAAVSMVRMITPAGIAILAIFGLTLARLDWQSLLAGRPRWRSMLLTALAGSVFVGTLTTGVLTSRHALASNRNMAGFFPDDLTRYMRENGRTGNIFNEYSLGGYLIYRLGDSNRVFIDGRTNILYPLEHFKRYKEAARDPDKLHAAIEQYGIDFVLLGNRREYVDLARLSGAVQLDYVDLRHSLYARQGANFPVSGALWFEPWCWDPAMKEGLAAEREPARLLPEYSPLAHLLRMAIDYADSPDPSTFLASLAEDPSVTWFESSLRFAGYRAIEQGQPELAQRWFSSIVNPSLKDYLAGSLASLRSGNEDLAEQILSNAIRKELPLPTYHDFRILQALIAEISNRRPLKHIEPEYFEELTDSLGESVLPRTSGLPEFDLCNVKGAFTKETQAPILVKDTKQTSDVPSPGEETLK